MKFLVLVLITLVSCIQVPQKPLRSQLEVRELQTREYTAKDLKQVMKAVIGALQDDGFIIRNADKELGFINASRELDVMNPNTAMWAQIFEGQNARYQKTSIMEASANVSEFGKDVRVRIVFQAKIMDNFGVPVDSKTVDDPVIYRDFFMKVDKSVFFERQRL